MALSPRNMFVLNRQQSDWHRHLVLVVREPESSLASYPCPSIQLLCELKLERVHNETVAQPSIPDHLGSHRKVADIMGAASRLAMDAHCSLAMIPVGIKRELNQVNR